MAVIRCVAWARGCPSGVRTRRRGAGPPFFGGVDPSSHRVGEHLFLKVAAFVDDRVFAFSEDSAVRGGQGQVPHLLDQGYGATYDCLVPGVHLDHNLRSHGTALSWGRRQRHFTKPRNLTPRELGYTRSGRGGVAASKRPRR